MNISEYTEDKAAGIIALKVQDDGSITMTRKRFDPRTGSPLEDEVAVVDTANVGQQIVQARAQLLQVKAQYESVKSTIDNGTALLSDLDAVLALAEPVVVDEPLN